MLMKIVSLSLFVNSMIQGASRAPNKGEIRLTAHDGNQIDARGNEAMLTRINN